MAVGKFELITTSLPPPGSCDQSVCGDPMGTFGVWSNATVAFAGVAQSVGFSPSFAFIFVDDVLVRLVSEETKSPHESPCEASDEASHQVSRQAPDENPNGARVPFQGGEGRRDALHENGDVDDEAQGCVRAVPSPGPLSRVTST
jgi:hypothetical protein